MVQWDDEKVYSDRNMFMQARASMIDALKQNKLKKASDGIWETAVVGTEYISPEQVGGIYGTVYRQYFTTSLPSDLTSGGNVTRQVDFYMRTHISTTFYSIRGNTRGYTSAEADIQLTSGNLAIVKETHVIDDGWVDYTK